MTSRRWSSRHASTAVLVVCFASCVILANWAILHVGVDHGAGHPRTLPLGFELEAPSGVVFAGALFTLRDVIHERIGGKGTLAVIVATAPLTAIATAPSLALASVATFIVAEVADLLVYARVRRRGRLAAVLASNVISSFIDSVVFLTLAFGAVTSVGTVAGMTIGKLVASAVTLLVVMGAVRSSRPWNLVATT